MRGYLVIAIAFAMPIFVALTDGSTYRFAEHHGIGMCSLRCGYELDLHVLAAAGPGEPGRRHLGANRRDRVGTKVGFRGRTVGNRIRSVGAYGGTAYSPGNGG